MKYEHTDSLPFRYPRIFWAHQCNNAIEVVARVIIYIVFIVLHAKKFITIITSITFELIETLKLKEIQVIIWM